MVDDGGVVQRYHLHRSMDIFRLIDLEFYITGTDEAPTQSQSTHVTGTTPYTLGFRKSLKNN